MSATRSNVLRLYKTMLRESQLFNNYNFRNYAIRRIRDAFKGNKNLQDCDAIEAAYNEAFTTLAIIKRQVIVSDLYKSEKLVIENFTQFGSSGAKKNYIAFGECYNKNVKKNGVKEFSAMDKLLKVENMSEKKQVDDYPYEETSSQAESFDANKSGTSETYDMKDFCPGIRIEAKDFDGKWYPAKVSDVDWTENEILVHFENWNTKFDEWIPMDSSRLRPIQKPVLQQKDVVKFSKGEEVMAVWSANQKYPGIIQAVLANDRYDVLFSDGFLKRLKGHKISKLQGGIIKPEVKTFTDIGTKEERRERKRKINVAELFHINKRSKKKGLVTSKPQDIKTYPVSKSRAKNSFIKKMESLEKSQEVSSFETKEEKQNDEKSLFSETAFGNKTLVDNIPAAFEVRYLNGQTETWSKQLYQRSEGRTAGKLDIVILNPQGRKFRSRNEIMKYCEENGIMYSHEAFDFSAKGRPKSKPIVQTPVLKAELNVEDKEKSFKKGIKKSQNDVLMESPNLGNITCHSENLPQENITPKKVFIGEYEVAIENGKFICPVKICAKHFRRENLLHMHMKHYHPEFSKYLDYTPSVTDLAYARTVGNLDAVETPPPTPRKMSGSDKVEKSAIKIETFKRGSDALSDSTKETKKIKINDKVEGKAHFVKPSSDVSSTPLASIEEPCDENSKSKIGSVGLSLGRNSSSLNEIEVEMQENSETVLGGNSCEQTPKSSENSSAISTAIKPSKHARLHGRKRSNRFQGSFSEHMRRRRFLSQDRIRSHNKPGRQQQSQLPAHHFPQTQPLQTTVSHQSCVDDINSNAPSQNHTMARYLKPHLNISNEVSGKNILLTNYKALSPVSEKNEKSERISEDSEINSETNTLKNLIEIRKKTQSACRRSFLAGLLSARKRKGKIIRKRRRKKKRDRPKTFIESSPLDQTLNEHESGRTKNVKKPDVLKVENKDFSCNYSILNDLKSYEKFQVPKLEKNLKVKIRCLSLDSVKKNEISDTNTILPNSSEPFIEAEKEADTNIIEIKDVGTKVANKLVHGFSRNLKSSAENVENSPREIKIKSEISPKELPKPYVLLENVLRKDFFELENLSQKNYEKCVKRYTNDRVVSSEISQKRGEERKRNKKLSSGKNNKRGLAKKVRFENRVLEKWIDEGEAFDWSKYNPKSEEIVRKEERKNKQRKSHLNVYFNENEMNQQKQLDDSSRDETCLPILKTGSLDQAEVTEDSKSPVAVENEKVEKLRRNEIINCLCGITEEDGLMIQCDICLCWQHGHCAGILRELDVPDKYTCAICKNPYRGRLSMRYLHDQEWLKEGTLPSLSFRSKRNDIIEQRKAILKRSHDLSGSITLLAQVIHSLRIKVNIAEKKDHPKLWLWAKKWTEKKPNRLKDESEVKEKFEEQNLDLTNEVKKEEVSSDEKHLPKAPEPEAPIDSAECRLNLLDHLIHYQSLIDARLSCIESLVAELESMQDDAVNDETPDRYPRTKATVQMILRDLNTMKKIATI